MENHRWRDEWLEVHYRERQKQIAQLAIEKAYRRYEWWQEFNNREQQPETD
jgi:hypothetical protein